MKLPINKWLLFLGMVIAFFAPRKVLGRILATAPALMTFMTPDAVKRQAVQERRLPARSTPGETMLIAQRARLPMGCRAGGWMNRIST